MSSTCSICQHDRQRQKRYTPTKSPVEADDVSPSSDEGAYSDSGNQNTRTGRVHRQNHMLKHGSQHQHKGRQPSKKYNMPTQSIRMPTGIIETITNPVFEKEDCGNDSFKLIKLRPTGRMGKREFDLVAKEMQNTVKELTLCETGGGCFKRYNIVSIKKVFNGCAWRKYQTRQKDVIAENYGDAHEVMLFHGSPSVMAVVASGFDERFSSAGGQLGAGIYFTNVSSAANQFVYGFYGGQGCEKHHNKNCYICDRQMLLCRVTLGKSQEFEYSSIAQISHPEPGYHSATGKPGKGTFNYHEYVIYRGEQAYPEYLITYKIIEENPTVKKNHKHGNYHK